MAKKEGNNGNSMGFGEISTIRDILMGQQMTEYEGRFVEIQDHIARVEKAYNEKLATLEANTIQQINNLQEEITARFDQLEASIEQQTKADKETHKQTLMKERQRLGKMLAEVSNQLLK